MTKVRLHGTNGYRVNVSTGHRHGVTVTVRRGDLTSEYRIQGANNGQYGADARLPGLGRVRFRFIPSGHERRVPPPPWCEGPDGRLLEGVVRGRIRFTGEGGYTHVAVHRAKATVEAWPEMRCRYLREEGDRSRRWTATFEAFRELPPNVSFSIRRHQGRKAKPVEFRAHIAGRRGPLRIFRSVALTADDSTFVRPDPQAAPENFTVVPPPPFSGSATFQRTPESVFNWEGDLSVQFLGMAAPMGLTGPAFSTKYCTRLGCVNQGSSAGGIPFLAAN